MEEELARHIVSLGKTPMGWEEILFRTLGAQATNGSAIVASWVNAEAAPTTYWFSGMFLRDCLC